MLKWFFKAIFKNPHNNLVLCPTFYKDTERLYFAQGHTTNGREGIINRYSLGNRLL